ncbi:MAG: hypothetical protein ACOX08_08220 [Methanobacterium sp.]|jgi:hypothetical protein|uniref:hypothetical protein n=1 Tax=Methanobacterium sp. MZD130B TaxID=3394378 RepID=UPI0039FD73A8
MNDKNKGLNLIMGFKNLWKKLKSFNLDFLYDFNWEEIKKDPDKMAIVSILTFGAEIMVTVGIVIGTLIYIYLRVFT